MATYRTKAVVKILVHEEERTGLIDRFITFLLSCGIHPVTRGGMSTPRSYTAYFRAADIEKITTWLSENGVECASTEL